MLEIRRKYVYFNKYQNMIQVHKDISVVYGEGTMNNQTCQKWIANFRSADICLV